MGRAGTRFGRNIPLDKVLPVTPEQLLRPSPREVSRRLLTRDDFLPATSINTMAASWLQFMIHDWFTHGEGDTSRLVDIPLKPGDPWYENPMRIPRIKNDPTRPADATGRSPPSTRRPTGGTARRSTARHRGAAAGALR